jgi:signal transduction histidine kinase
MPWKRLLLGLVLGGVLAGGITGLAIALLDSQSRTHADVERSAQERASLAADLIDSIFAASNSSRGLGPISQRRVSPAELHAAIADAPLAAVLGPHGELLASTPAQSPSVTNQLTRDPSVRAALAGQAIAVSNVLPAKGPLAAGFLDAAPYSTPYGRRVIVGWYPLRHITTTLQHYLSQVAHDVGADVYLVDSNAAVVGSSSITAQLGTAISDRALLRALNHPSGGSDGGSAVMYAVSSLHSAPWRVLYTVPTSGIGASTVTNEKLSFLLLAGCGLGGAICLILLVRLSFRLRGLSNTNTALAQRNAEVEQATEAKSRFLANMSHELRTPLNGIIGFAELMHDGRIGPVSDEHRECLDDIRGSARHLLHLINEVLDLARIESGRILLDRQPITPSNVASDCVDSLRPIAAEGEVSVTLASEPIGIVMLDGGRLRQVLINYLSNAIKFTAPHGHVEVLLRREHDELVVEVSDTGPGIDLADQERVFGEFEQLTGRGHGGTGLGLAVTKRIVEAQHGTVGVRSTPGHGSTFYARLPIIDAAVAPDTSSQDRMSLIAEGVGR